MFERPKEDKELGIHKAWIGAFVLIVAIIVGLVAFRAYQKGPARGSAQAASAADLANANPVKDLKIERATMQKDNLGATAIWMVTLVNKSEKLTYSSITYHTEYIAADNHLILENNGTISATIGPNGENSSEIRDVAYPSGVAWYKFRITGAKAKVE